MSGRIWSFIKRKRDRATCIPGGQPLKNDSKIPEEVNHHEPATPTLVFTHDNDETLTRTLEEKDIATSKVITRNHNIHESQSMPSRLQVNERKHGVSLSSNRHGRNRHSPDLKQQTTSTSLHDGEEKINVPSDHRPRVGSDVSGTSSYHTCKSSRSSLHHSPTSNRTKDGIIFSTVMKDELQNVMREVFDKRMTELESKMDASQQRLESRVVEIEKKLQIHNEIPDVPKVPVDEEKTIELPTNLPVLTEVCNYSHIVACIQTQ